MAEETEKAQEGPPTVEELAEHLSRVQSHLGYSSLHDLWWPQQSHRLRSYKQPLTFRVRDAGGQFDYVIFTSPNVEQAANSNELALSGAPVSKEEPQSESKSGVFTTNLPPDDITASALIASAVAEIERAGEIMRRDEEEIQRLKEETRAVLRKLAA